MSDNIALKDNIDELLAKNSELAQQVDDQATLLQTMRQQESNSYSEIELVRQRDHYRDELEKLKAENSRNQPVQDVQFATFEDQSMFKKVILIDLIHPICIGKC